PKASICFTTSPRWAASPYFEGASQLRSCTATSAPRIARRRAMTFPSPRPEPDTKAVLPLRSSAKIALPSHQSERLHVRGRSPDHGKLVLHKFAIRPTLPGCAPFGIIGQAVASCRKKAGRKFLGRLGRIAMPPFRREEPHMARFQSSRLEHGGHGIVMFSEQGEEFGERH